jgi:hypothetical protein
VFAQNDSVFAGISFPSDAAPVLADIDNDGDLDLVIGMLFGDLRCYMNIGSRNKPIWSRNDTLFANVSVDQNSHPAFADLDNDGRLDLIIGEYNGNFTFYKNNFAITSVKDKPVSALSGYRLYQNYPNPFNPSTTISYQIQNTGLVSLIVYDVLGRAIRTLVSEEVARGDHSVQFSGADLPSGVYLCTLKAGDFVSTKKMILLK